MTGLDFEFFVRDCLRAKGYESIEMTAKSGDYGADLILRQVDAPKIIVIQCKLSARSVGVQAVQEVLGAKKFYRANEAWVVTDATFTQAAKTLARASKVRLKRLIWAANRHFL